MNKIAVSDICDTLYFSNTTFDFIRFCVEMKYFKKYKRVKHGILLNKKSPFFWVIVAAGKMMKNDFAKKIAVSLLRSCKVEEVKDWTYSFYDKQLAEKKINESFRVLETGSKEEWILASSTLYPIAEVIAEKIGITKFIATKLCVDKEIYTGKICEDTTGRKYQFLEKYFYKDGFEIDIVVTDNISDMDLIRKAERKVVVCHGKKYINYWNCINNVDILLINR